MLFHSPELRQHLCPIPHGSWVAWTCRWRLTLPALGVLKRGWGINREPCAAVSGSAVCAWRKDAFAENANWVSCWNSPLIPLLRLCCCCSLLPRALISFRYQWGRTTVSDREKVILIHLLPSLWLPPFFFFFLSVKEYWPVFSFGQGLIFKAECVLPLCLA